MHIPGTAMNPMQEPSRPVDRHDLTTAQAEASEWRNLPTIIPTSAEPNHKRIVDQGAIVQYSHER
jgi:hypothetical protein